MLSCVFWHLVLKHQVYWNVPMCLLIYFCFVCVCSVSVLQSILSTEACKSGMPTVSELMQTPWVHHIVSLCVVVVNDRTVLSLSQCLEFKVRHVQEPERHLFVFCRLFSDVYLQHSEKLHIKVRGSVWYHYWEFGQARRGFASEYLLSKF